MRRNPENEAVKFEMNNLQTETVESEMQEFENETVRFEILKPTSDAVGFEVMEPVIATGSQKRKRQKPNYFVAIQISNDQIIGSLSKVQQHILNKDQRFMNAMKPLTTAHITLMVMYIGDPETHARALIALKNVHEELEDDLSKNPFQLEFKGLSQFNHKILFAKPSANSRNRLISWADIVRKHYADVSIKSTDTRKTINPHLTVLDVRDAWRKEEADQNSHNESNLPETIDPSLYRDFMYRYFGSQDIQNVQLLSMDDPKDESGYYSGDTIYFTPKKRTKLTLLPRSKPVEVVAPPSEFATSISIFGEAKPVDTAAKYREVEERLCNENETAKHS